MKNHDSFMREVKEAISLPAQTSKALAPESDEDRAMYNGDSRNKQVDNTAQNTGIPGKDDGLHAGSTARNVNKASLERKNKNDEKVFKDKNIKKEVEDGNR